MSNDISYQETKPSESLKELVHSFWQHNNNADSPEAMTIFPDSFFKIILLLREGSIVRYFMTGIWTEQQQFTIPAKTTTIGCRLKILAPEFLIREEVATIVDNYRQLDLSYLNMRSLDKVDFQSVVQHLEQELIMRKSMNKIQGNKLRLSQLLYQQNGSISAKAVSEQIFWSNRQINRYLNKHIGVSLKKYLNIQKCYQSYLQIRDGRFFPEKDYFDQAHFIREIKKHTGETPTSLHDQQNDRFIQLKHIKGK